jgi:hypothetical protein
MHLWAAQGLPQVVAACVGHGGMIYKCSKLRTGLDWDGRVFVRTSQEGYERHILQRGHPCCIVPFAYFPIVEGLPYVIERFGALGSPLPAHSRRPRGARSQGRGPEPRTTHVGAQRGNVAAGSGRRGVGGGRVAGASAGGAGRVEGASGGAWGWRVGVAKGERVGLAPKEFSGHLDQLTLAPSGPGAPPHPCRRPGGKRAPPARRGRRRAEAEENGRWREARGGAWGGVGEWCGGAKERGGPKRPKEAKRICHGECVVFYRLKCCVYIKYAILHVS